MAVAEWRRAYIVHHRIARHRRPRISRIDVESDLIKRGHGVASVVAGPVHLDGHVAGAIVGLVHGHRAFPPFRSSVPERLAGVEQPERRLDSDSQGSSRVHPAVVFLKENDDAD